ncbi:hypothetical protein AAFF_G00238810, partial [Aldrovandia affinis]
RAAGGAAQRSWGTVCDDDWGYGGRQRQSRQLGHGSAVAVASSSAFGQGSGRSYWTTWTARAGSKDWAIKSGSLGWGSTTAITTRTWNHLQSGWLHPAHGRG